MKKITQTTIERLLENEKTLDDLVRHPNAYEDYEVLQVVENVSHELMSMRMALESEKRMIDEFDIILDSVGGAHKANGDVLLSKKAIKKELLKIKPKFEYPIHTQQTEKGWKVRVYRGKYIYQGNGKTLKTARDQAFKLLDGDLKTN